MPDSLLPIQGPASQRERDLDALLSGYPTVVLGPVAGVLGALRGAPAPGELDGEAAARAAFRLFVLPDAGAPRLPLTAPGGPRHRRPRRRAPRQGRWQVMTVACAVAAVVIVGAVALAGSFSGPGGRQGHAGQGLSAAPSATDATSVSPKSQVDGRASPAPRPQPAALCRQYMDFFTHPESAANRQAETAIVRQLRTLAGGLPQITGYCFRQLGMAGPGPDGGYQGGAGAPGSGNQQGRDRFGEPVMPRLSRSGAGSHFGGR
jgi:hypothetical protein